MSLERKEKIAISGSLISFFVFVFLMKTSGLSVGSAVNMQISLLLAFITNKPFDFLTPFLIGIFSVVFLSLSFAFLASYGYSSENKRTGTIAGVLCAVVSIIAFPTIAGVFLALAMVLSGGYIVLLANTYGRELKRWIRFRVGSNSIGKVLLIVNLFVALGILISVALSSSVYETSLKTDLKSTLMEAIPVESYVPQSGLPPEARALLSAEVEKRVNEQIDAALNSPFFAAYFRWLPFITAFGAWVILEFLRNLVFSNVGGVFSYFLTGTGKKHGK